MAQDKVYIVLSHKHSLKKGTNDQWEVAEQVEFVNQLRDKHHTMSSAIGSFLDRKIITGARHGFTDYAVFENYVAKKYEKQLNELISAYPRDELDTMIAAPTITDQFGNKRTPTVFDKV